MKPIFIKNFLPPQVLNLAYSYCVLKYSTKLDLSNVNDVSIANNAGDTARINYCSSNGFTY